MGRNNQNPSEKSRGSDVTWKEKMTPPPQGRSEVLTDLGKVGLSATLFLNQRW